MNHKRELSSFPHACISLVVSAFITVQFTSILRTFFNEARRFMNSIMLMRKFINRGFLAPVSQLIPNEIFIVPANMAFRYLNGDASRLVVFFGIKTVIRLPTRAYRNIANRASRKKSSTDHAGGRNRDMQTATIDRL